MAHYSFQGLPVVLVGGFVMAFLYVRTRNIWISIAVHFMNNLIAVLPIAVNYLFGAEASTAVNVVSFYAVILVGIAALAILCVLHASGPPGVPHADAARAAGPEQGAAARRQPRLYRVFHRVHRDVRGVALCGLRRADGNSCPTGGSWKRRSRLRKRRMRRGKSPVGAVVVKDGAVIGRGRNRREASRSVLGHAELEAMEQAAASLGDWRLSGCTLYVTLEPCPMCAGAAVNAHVERIVYGAEDEVMGACGHGRFVIRLPRAFRPALYKGLLGEECGALLRRFFAERRK